MKVPASALKNVLSARGLDVATLALRSGVSRKALQRVINDEGELDDDDIVSIADELAVPVQALFAKQGLPLFPAVDFRTTHPGVGEFAKGTLHAINFVERLSTTLAALNIDVSLSSEVQEYKTTKYSKDEAWNLAALWRGKWGVKDDDQIDWQDANKLYTSLRTFIENLGVVVVHRQFKTDEASGLYIQVDGGPHTIVVNTTGSGKPRKLFTLAHEFAHVLLRAEGASNPSVIKNRVERFCNWFAAALLAPKRLIERALEPFQNRAQADSDFIRRFAKKLGISQEAAFLRLVETGYLQQSDYDAWKAKFDNTNHVPTADMSDGGGGGTANPLRDKQTQYGSTLLRLLGQARRMGMLDEIDIYRLCGLKPKYQDQLFVVAQRMAALSKSAAAPKWIIDLHGIKEALSSRSNAKARIIDAIKSGEMWVIRSVQDELKIFENLWADFAAIKPKKYVDTPASVNAAAAAMQEANGSSLLGSVPSFAHFEALALARSKKCKLVTAGKGMSDCQSIAKKCSLPKTDIVGISDV